MADNRHSSSLPLTIWEKIDGCYWAVVTGFQPSCFPGLISEKGAMLDRRGAARANSLRAGANVRVMRVSQELEQQFGAIDIYLFDQLLRGRFDERRRILDAGCGSGRNLIFFVAHGFDVCAIDADPSSVTAVRRIAPAADVRHGQLTALPWHAQSMDAVISSAVLHFADDDHHFEAMVREMWRVLRPGGLFFARLASSIGIERLLPSPTGRMRLPDGSDRYVVNEEMLLTLVRDLGAVLLDPIKSTNVHNQRVMTTWVIEKSA